MKMLKILAILFAVLVFIGCSDDCCGGCECVDGGGNPGGGDNIINSIAGTWEGLGMDDGLPMRWQYVFNSNNRGTYRHYYNNDLSGTGIFAWEQIGEIVFIIYTEEASGARSFFYSGGMTFNWGGMTFTKM